jgi:hypothetical protein
MWFNSYYTKTNNSFTKTIAGYILLSMACLTLQASANTEAKTEAKPETLKRWDGEMHRAFSAIHATTGQSVMKLPSSLPCTSAAVLVATRIKTAT